MSAAVKAGLAVWVVIGSVVWGFSILRSDVYAPISFDNASECGVVGMIVVAGDVIIVSGDPNYDAADFEAACTRQALHDARPAVVPGVLGVAAMTYLGVGFVAAVRRSRAVGHSAGALPH